MELTVIISLFMRLFGLLEPMCIILKTMFMLNEALQGCENAIYGHIDVSFIFLKTFYSTSISVIYQL